MSLEKIKVWIASDGRLDVTEGRGPRELEALDRFCRIALDLDGVELGIASRISSLSEPCLGKLRNILRLMTAG